MTVRHRTRTACPRRHPTVPTELRQHLRRLPRVTGGSPYIVESVACGDGCFVTLPGSRIVGIRVPAPTVSLRPLRGGRPLGRLNLTDIGWAIAGRESGPAVRSIRHQCLAHGVGFPSSSGRRPNKKKTGRILNGRTWDEQRTKPRRTGNRKQVLLAVQRSASFPIFRMGGRGGQRFWINAPALQLCLNVPVSRVLGQLRDYGENFSFGLGEALRASAAPRNQYRVPLDHGDCVLRWSTM